MKHIPLTQGYVAIVDDENYDRLIQWRWVVVKHKNNRCYAIRQNKQQQTIYMHREIMNTPKGMDTDHINRDGLDNRECNLRICTRSQNNCNQIPRTNCKSKYKGVSQQRKRWKAAIQNNRKLKFIGEYNTEIEAAKAYDKRAIELFGEFARINTYN